MSDVLIDQPRHVLDMFEEYLGTPLSDDSIINFKLSLSLDEQDAFPTECIEYVKQWGYCEHLVPVEWGGKLADLSSLYYLSKALSRRDLTISIALGLSLLSSLPVWVAGSEKMKKQLGSLLSAGKMGCIALTEEEHGSDLLSNQVSAALVDDCWHLKGRKWCINHATLGDTVTLLAKTREHRGVLSSSVFFFDKKELSGPVSNTPKILTHGVRGLDISGFDLNHTRIPEHSLVGEKHRGFEVIAKTLQVSRALCANLSIGSADTALRLAMQFATQRLIYAKSAWEIDVLRQRLTRCYCLLITAEIVALTVIRTVTLHAKRLPLWSSISKFIVPLIGEEIFNVCSKVIGARAYMRDGEYGMFQKMKRDNQIVGLFDGSSEVNLAIISEHLIQQAHYRKGVCHDKDYRLARLFDFSHPEPNFNTDDFSLFNRGADEVVAYIHQAARQDGENCLAVSQALSLMDESILELADEGEFKKQGLREFEWAKQYCWFFAYGCLLQYRQTNPSSLSVNFYDMASSVLQQEILGGVINIDESISDSVAEELLHHFQAGEMFSLYPTVSR